MRFLAGLLTGLIALVAYAGYHQFRTHQDPCLGVCGEGTSCAEGVCIVEAPAETSRSSKKRKRRGGRRRRPRTTAAALQAQAELKQPTASDLQVLSRGPSLRQTEVLRMDEDEVGDRSSELSDAEVTRRVSKLDRRIAACIDQARGDYALSQGTVMLGLRIERGGQIEKIRVSAPALLLRAGLYDCIKPLLTGLRFRPSSRATVISYPYVLR